jgi:hypothetical protein
VNEIAAVIIGDGEQITGSQDIIVYRKGHPLELFRISDSHPLPLELRYNTTASKSKPFLPSQPLVLTLLLDFVPLS